MEMANSSRSRLAHVPHLPCIQGAAGAADSKRDRGRSQPIVSSLNYGSLSLFLCSMADQGPESSVMPSGSALFVGRRGDLYRSVSCETPDGRFVDMITRLGSRMDDMVAESKSATPREVLTPLLNLSSGDQRSAQARHAAPKSPC
ncbi:hypothetical protein GBF38_018986 [Nibea albiflora]|uniref:Uncharacterized protein n=1 Tax=Nibea albiflora TaxID=240163 RepID=A0ACB7EPJ3_NIBAL|nr:hypothetical protein GBF38_018986 [Nibea albiflora]